MHPRLAEAMRAEAMKQTAADVAALKEQQAAILEKLDTIIAFHENRKAAEPAKKQVATAGKG